MQLNAEVVTDVELANNSVDTPAIQDFAVTNDKVLNQSIQGSGYLDTNLGGSKFSSGSIGEADIADSAISRDKIENGAVTENKIGSTAVTNSKIAIQTITGAIDSSISNNANSRIKPESVGTTDIANSSIINSRIADSAVTTEKLMDQTIVDADINNTAAITESKVNLAHNTTKLYTNISILEEKALKNTNGTDIYLTEGWNEFRLPWFVLVGTNYTGPLSLGNNYSVGNVLSTISGKYDYVAYYDGSNWQTYHNTTDNTFSVFPTTAGQPDYIYHIHMNSAGRLTIYS